MLAEPELLEPIWNTITEKESHVSDDRLFVLDTQPSQAVPMGYRSWLTLQDHGEEDWIRFNDLSCCLDTTAAFFFSSGTTGLPKAVMISHRNLIAQHTLVFGSEVRPYRISIVLCVPMLHIGIGPLAFTSVLKGGWTVYVMRRFELRSYLCLHTEYQVNECLIAPSIGNSIVTSGLADPEGDNYDSRCNLRSVRYGLIGGAPPSTSMQRRLQRLMAPGATLGQLWGMTELTCRALQVGIGMRAREEDADYFGSVGSPIQNLEIKLVDEEDNDISNMGGIVGEICVRGPTVMRGYFENEKATKEVFYNDGYIRSGDMGYVDSNTGLWYIVDRKKELIKVRGFQVAPAEIENVLLLHPGILDAAVIGVKVHGVTAPEGSTGDVGEEAPRAYVIRNNGQSGKQIALPSAEDIQKFVRERLAKYKALDGGVRIVESIPRNASGKVLKRILKDWALSEPDMAR